MSKKFFFVNFSRIILFYFRLNESISFTPPQLINAVLSQLYFSQISAWLSSKESELQLTSKNIKYILSIPGETYEHCQFIKPPNSHIFPPTILSSGNFLNIKLLNLPRLSEIPNIKCSKHEAATGKPVNLSQIEGKILLDDRMHTSCMLKGKHRCEDFDDIDNVLKKTGKYSNCKRICQTLNKKTENNILDTNIIYSSAPGPSTANNGQHDKNELNANENKIYKAFHEHFGIHFLNKTKNSENLELNKFEKHNIEQHKTTPKLDIELSKDEIREVMQVLNQNSNKAKNDLKQQSKNILRNVMLKKYRYADEKFQCDNDNSTNIFRAETKSQNLIFDKDESVNSTAKVICDFKCVRKNEHLDLSSWEDCEKASDCDLRICDKLCENSDIFNIKNKKKTKIYIDPDCDKFISHEPKAISKMRDISNINHTLNYSNKGKSRLPIRIEHLKNNEIQNEKNVNKTIENSTVVIDIPSPTDQAKFRKSFDNAASMVFHSKTGLPLTSSPAPVRKGKKCFDFDSSINSVSAIKRYSNTRNCNTIL